MRGRRPFRQTSGVHHHHGHQTHHLDVSKLWQRRDQINCLPSYSGDNISHPPFSLSYFCFTSPIHIQHRSEPSQFQYQMKKSMTDSALNLSALIYSSQPGTLNQDHPLNSKRSLDLSTYVTWKDPQAGGEAEPYRLSSPISGMR